MAVTGVSAYTNVYGSGNVSENTTAKSSQKEAEQKAAEQKEQAAVYEESSKESKDTTYSVNKMSEQDRAALVKQLKSEQSQRQQQLVNLVQKMLSQQTNAYGKANDIWKFLKNGNYKVDAATRLQAQADIGEDGYYGVKQTSQRLFDFASALAGDDVEQMKKMEAAVEKGFKLAEKKWGGELPGICGETLKATRQLFADYYKAHETAEEN